MSIYIFSLCDYEDYKPFYFDCDCSKEDFERAVQGCLSRATDHMIALKIAESEEWGCDSIDGYDLIDQTVKFLEELGHKLIIAEHEVRIHGMCRYDESDNKPEVMSEDAWKKIIAHNKKAIEEFYKEIAKEEKEEK